MAKPNYQFEKRQRDLAKKNKQEEKRRQKLADKNSSEQSANVDQDQIDGVPLATVGSQVD